MCFNLENEFKSWSSGRSREWLLVLPHILVIAPQTLESLAKKWSFKNKKNLHLILKVLLPLPIILKVRCMHPPIAGVCHLHNSFLTGVTKFGLEKVFITVQFSLVGMDEQYSKWYERILWDRKTKHVSVLNLIDLINVVCCWYLFINSFIKKKTAKV